MRRMTGGRAVVEALRGEGIEQVFGIVGTNNVHLFDALFDEPRNVLPKLKTAAARRSALAGMTYRDFLTKAWQVDESVLRYFQGDTQGYFGVGIDATTALDAWAAGLPGFDGLSLGDEVDARQSPSGRQLKASQDEYIYHFPDGNAGVARALVRSLIGGIVVHATPAPEPLGLEVEGSLAALLTEAPELEHSGISCSRPPQPGAVPKVVGIWRVGPRRR